MRLAFVLAAILVSCSHPPRKKDVTPGQVIVTDDATFTTREGDAIDANVIRRFGEHQGTGAATLHGMTCGIHSMAITETGPSRSPKPVDGDHRNRFIAIGGPANLAVIT